MRPGSFVVLLVVSAASGCRGEAPARGASYRTRLV